MAVLRGLGLISAFAPWFRERLALSATQTALLVAVPVLLGAVARLPKGLLSDRDPAAPSGARHEHDVPSPAIGTPRMNDPEKVRRHGIVSIDGALTLIAVLLVVQMWLLTAALESQLAGHYETTLPAAAVSAVLFLACMGLYLFVDALDAEVRRE